MTDGVFDPQQLGVEGYQHLYPLVTTDLTRRQLHPAARLDPSDGPVTISPPHTGDRYALLPVLDLRTYVLAAPG